MACQGGAALASQPTLHVFKFGQRITTVSANHRRRALTECTPRGHGLIVGQNTLHDFDTGVVAGSLL